MNKPFFSIITPVYIHNGYRHYQLLRAIQSVASQSFTDFEMIVQDEGSPVSFVEDLKWLQPRYPWLKYERTPDHIERVNNYYNAMLRITGEWIVFCDSDDMLVPYALEAMDDFIKKNPDYKMFNFGSIHYHKNYQVNFRGPFRPAKLAVGHELFGKGNIVNGTFIFHRSVYDDIGGFPHGVIVPEDQEEMLKVYNRKGELNICSPWDFSCWFQLKYPEVRPFCMTDHVNEPKKIIAELGNPWGNDFSLFYMMTRKHHSLPIDLYLYQVFMK